MKYFWSNDFNCVYQGDMQPGDREATAEEIEKHLNPPTKEVTAEDYDKAMEEHIYTTRAARGYTTREPSCYLQSSVPRWKQDAIDWVYFIDRCMLYGLEVQNRYAAGEEIPSLEDFKTNLPQITWTYED